MASIASANRPSLRKSYPNISIHKDARADFRLPIADSKSNVVIHLKGFASYLDFENHQDTKIGKSSNQIRVSEVSEE